MERMDGAGKFEAVMDAVSLAPIWGRPAASFGVDWLSSKACTAGQHRSLEMFATFFVPVVVFLFVRAAIAERLRAENIVTATDGSGGAGLVRTLKLAIVRQAVA